jgi:hypothetical protein
VFAGVFGGVRFGVSQLTQSVLGEAGPRTLGLVGTSDRRWLLQWDLLLALRGGYQIATPLTKLFGGHGLLDGECGYRFPARSAWSPYAIAGGSLEAQRLALTGAQPASLNDPDAVSGLNLKGRLGGGGSYLDGDRSLRVVAFAQESQRLKDFTSRGALYTEVGLSVRYDLGASLSLSAQATWGEARPVRDSALDLTDQASRLEGYFTVRKGFANGIWIGASGNAARQMDRVVYLGSGATYSTASAPTFGLTVTIGLPIGG